MRHLTVNGPHYPSLFTRSDWYPPESSRRMVVRGRGVLKSYRDLESLVDLVFSKSWKGLDKMVVLR